MVSSSSSSGVGDVNVSLQVVINVAHAAVDGTAGRQSRLVAPVHSVSNDQ